LASGHVFGQAGVTVVAIIGIMLAIQMESWRSSRRGGSVCYDGR